MVKLVTLCTKNAIFCSEQNGAPIEGQKGYILNKGLLSLKHPKSQVSEHTCIGF